MSNLAPAEIESNVEYVSRFQALGAGQYWRARVGIEDEGIPEGTVLLIRSIRWVDDAPHTIILRPHPDRLSVTPRLGAHRFLLGQFLEAFEFEPDHQRVRDSEIRALQGRIGALQAELIDAQAHPDRLTQIALQALGEPDAALSAPTQDNCLVSMAAGSVAAAIRAGITAECITALKAVVGREQQIAGLKSQWIQGKTTEIARAIQALTPYYEEQAAAALAQTEDVREYVTKLMDGIASLDLYMGNGVEVQSIREGESAHNDVPLTFVQRKLMMDEELAVWADVHEAFDFQSETAFFDALRAHDELVTQIFPTERCVLVMAVTRRFIEYRDEWLNNVNNEENRKVFLLVRNGENLYRVFSPVESHLGAARLFPSQDEHAGIFRGIDGSQIKFEDVVYTDKLSKHEKYALHYKRFLLLACGLDHRLKLFGDFYDGPPSFHFVSRDFQDRHCRFLHDDDGAGLLPGEEIQLVREWIKEKNAFLQSGSRVLCNWFAVMDPVSAPSVCRLVRDRVDFRYRPTESMSIAVAYRDGQSLCVDVEVDGYSTSGKPRRFKTKVDLSKYESEGLQDTELGFLCLDAVRPDEVRRYIHHRQSRKDHLFYIRFFKHAEQFLKEERAREAHPRKMLVQALEEGELATGERAEAIVEQAVIAWRSTNRGKPLPGFETPASRAAWRSLLDQMFLLAGEGTRQTEEIGAYLTGKGYTPLRLAVSGSARLVAYVAPLPEETDDRLEPHAWVLRLVLERGQSGYVERYRSPVPLARCFASETVLHQWPEASAWEGRASVFRSLAAKRERLGMCGNVAQRLAPFLSPMDAETFKVHFEAWCVARSAVLASSRMVFSPALVLPIGMFCRRGDKVPTFLCVGTDAPQALLYRLAPSAEARESVRRRFCQPYAKQAVATSIFDASIAAPYPWRLFEVDAGLSASTGAAYAHHALGASFQPAKGVQPDVVPNLDGMLVRWLQCMDGRHASVWLADGVLDANVAPTLDASMGIVLPDDFSPTCVVSYVFHGDDNTERMRVFDLGEPGIRSRWPDRLPPGCSGAASTQKTYLTRAAAIAGMEAEAAGLGTLVPATDHPGAFMPSASIERWYVVKA